MPATKNSPRHIIYLFLTAIIWGVAFVAQSEGGNAVGPYSFSFIRFIIGALFLIPVIKMFDRRGTSKKRPQTKEEKRLLYRSGIICGILLCTATIFQQLGLYMGSSAGKTGFITACYIVIVPIIGLFLKQKCSWNVWLAISITPIGLYLLCMNGSFSLQLSDISTMICAVLFSFQIIAVDRVANRVDVVRLSFLQSAVSAIISLIPALIFEIRPLSGGFPDFASQLMSWDAWIPLLYTGILSSGVAYTLQNVGQVGVKPALASLILSLESVVSALAGWLILHEVLGTRELFGCAVVFAAVILAQLPIDKIFKKTKMT